MGCTNSKEWEAQMKAEGWERPLERPEFDDDDSFAKLKALQSDHFLLMNSKLGMLNGDGADANGEVPLVRSRSLGSGGKVVDSSRALDRRDEQRVGSREDNLAIAKGSWLGNEPGFVKGNGAKDVVDAETIDLWELMQGIDDDEAAGGGNSNVSGSVTPKEMSSPALGVVTAKIAGVGLNLEKEVNKRRKSFEFALASPAGRAAIAATYARSKSTTPPPRRPARIPSAPPRPSSERLVPSEGGPSPQPPVASTAASTVQDTRSTPVGESIVAPVGESIVAPEPQRLGVAEATAGAGKLEGPTTSTTKTEKPAPRPVEGETDRPMATAAQRLGMLQARKVSSSSLPAVRKPVTLGGAQTLGAAGEKAGAKKTETSGNTAVDKPSTVAANKPVLTAAADKPRSTAGDNLRPTTGVDKPGATAAGDKARPTVVDKHAALAEQKNASVAGQQKQVIAAAVQKFESTAAQKLGPAAGAQKKQGVQKAAPQEKVPASQRVANVVQRQEQPTAEKPVSSPSAVRRLDMDAPQRRASEPPANVSIPLEGSYVNVNKGDASSPVRPPSSDLQAEPVLVDFGSDGPVFDPELVASFERALELFSEEDWDALKGEGSDGEDSIFSPMKSPLGKLELSSPGSGRQGGLLGQGSAPVKDSRKSGAVADDKGLPGKKQLPLPLDRSSWEDQTPPQTPSPKASLKSSPSLNKSPTPKSPPRGAERIVVYTTSLRTIRKTFEDCNFVRTLFEGMSLDIDERDISMHTDFRHELKKLMGGPATVPRVFIRGEYIGGVDEIKQLNEDGELEELLQDVPRGKQRKSCGGCGGMRFLPCGTCDGSRKVAAQVAEGEEIVRCPDCNENGLQLCRVCA